MKKPLPFKPVWLLLALPAVLLIPGGDTMDLTALSGEIAAKCLLLALTVTPLVEALRPWPSLRAAAARLLRYRRAIGVAAFCYALIHLAYYAVDMGRLDDMLAELGAPGIWTGWVALALMLPLAATSNDAAVRRLKHGWKRLQRLAYPVALLTFAHWVLVHDGQQEALLYCAPLAFLQIIRIISRHGATRRPAGA